MSTNYIDTLTMYYPCLYDIRNLFTTHWIWDNKEQNCNLHHFCIKTKYAFIRYYPDMYGRKRLYITCSLPKLYNQSNSNTFNIHDYNNQTFMTILQNELGKVMNIAKLPTVLSDWQPSRIDLFRMRKINPANRLEYHSAYSRLTYRNVQSSTYMNTNYLPSSKNSKSPGILLRSYNKTIEIQDKQSLLYGNLPSIIEQEQEQLINELDIPFDQYRYEFSLRRNAIIRYCNKYNIPLNMERIMDEGFQKRLLNELVISRGLHYNILSKKEYRRIVGKIFHWKSTINLALKLAESIRNKKPFPIKPYQRYHIQRKLNGYFISTATTNFVSIQGLNLLK